MSFGTVNEKTPVDQLNNFLADHSYISGYTPTQADLTVFNTLGKEPTGNLPHLQRWYRHIASFDSNEKSTWSSAPAPLAAVPIPTTTTSAPAPAADDDDVDLFGSDEEEDKEAERIREERLAEYAAKKSKKPALVAKSSVILDVKPWDDETDMKELEARVRTIEMDGLLWGASKLVPVGYGIHKLQICCVIEDEKVSIDLLSEKIQEFEDYVQSVDVAAFNKI